MRFNIKFYFTFFCCWVWAQVAYTQLYDFEVLFGRDYTLACSFFEQNRWMDVMFAQKRINPYFARSVVFPEVLRYNVLRDQIEIQGLQCLYVQYGKAYANFSVGQFQIKPSFAEDIERDLYAYSDLLSETGGLDTSQTPQARLSRVKRLTDIHWQVKYLTWFIAILERRFKMSLPADNTQRLLFFATAYNCGYKHNLDYILKKQQQSWFHTGLFTSAAYYNYAAISKSYWNRINNPSGSYSK